MRHKDDNGLAWSGRAIPTRSGGFVDGVGLNEPTHQLAVDPEGVVQAEREGPHGAGLALEVERLGEGPVAPRNGRVRLA